MSTYNRNLKEINSLSEALIRKEDKLKELTTDIDMYKFKLKNLANESLEYEKFLLKTILKYDVNNFLNFFKLTKYKKLAKIGEAMKGSGIDYIYFTFKLNENMYNLYIPYNIREITEYNYLDYYKYELYIEDKPYCWELVNKFESPDKIIDYLQSIKESEK